MNIGIIGGGAFGIMTAIRLAEMGQSVGLFERLPSLMTGASFNANRLHLGFHYPRDEETAYQCMRGFWRVRREFESAILKGVSNNYFIAAKGSLTSPNDFLAFCSRMGLFHKKIDLDTFSPAIRNVELGIATDEHVIDTAIFREMMIERLYRSGVSIHVNSNVIDISRNGMGQFRLSVEGNGITSFDAVVNCSYGEINRLTARLGHDISPRQYEYIAAAIIDIDFGASTNITILDGPFFTLLPFGQTGHHLLVHVQHSVIAAAREPLLDPLWLNPETSPFASVDRERWYDRLLESCCDFVPALRGARLRHIIQSPRMVLADRDATDSRPSIVTVHEPGYLTVLASKIDHCIWVADDVATSLGICKNI
jgi:glycine/D-amino acid oxidase-like deaminating enzyme